MSHVEVHTARSVSRRTAAFCTGGDIVMVWAGYLPWFYVPIGSLQTFISVAEAAEIARAIKRYCGFITDSCSPATSSFYLPNRQDKCLRYVQGNVEPLFRKCR
ncbi:hypothetical protein KCP73_07790 [Salmonella enterica subsp. enterica]|nr:hypothetical protein KCP73_07790 [Salmonella enterica subsp. enterica]